MRVGRAYLFFFLALAFGFLAGAFLLFGGSGGLIPTVVAALLAVGCSVVAWRASAP